MNWNKVLQLLLSGSLVAPAPKTQTAANQPVQLEEILSYQCARSVTTMVTSDQQVGPLFSSGSLVFTSLVAEDSSKLLLVNAGGGNFAIPLVGDGVNRIRFAIPTADVGPDRLFFMSYSHGGALRSRYFDYSELVAPVGHDDLDFAEVEPQRASYLQPHLDYAIHETASTILSAITDGKISRAHMIPHRAENCEHLSRQAPSVARNLKYNLDMLDVILMGPTHGFAARRPASATR
jgi:hypothetical protein